MKVKHMTFFDWGLRRTNTVRLYGEFSFTDGGRYQVPLLALFQAWAVTWVKSPPFSKLDGHTTLFNSKINIIKIAFYGIYTARYIAQGKCQLAINIAEMNILKKGHLNIFNKCHFYCPVY